MGDIWREWTIGSTDDDPKAEEGYVWMRERPTCIRELMLRFPPSCLVKTKPTAVTECLPEDKLMAVTGYKEQDCGCNLLMVRMGPDDPYLHTCHPDEVEIVRYYKDMDQNKVRAILGVEVN